MNRSYNGVVGEAFAARASAPGLNSLHERPGVVSLIGNVADQRIVDLGCGAGHLAKELVSLGARLTCVEGSDSLVNHARTALGPATPVIRHDLEAPLTFLDDESQDGVVCTLVHHHLSNRPAFLEDVFRILRPGGWFVLSSTHPTADWGRFGGSYFDQRWVHRQLDEHSVITYELMPMSVLVNELLDAGFTLDRMLEPQPDPELQNVLPDKFEGLSTAPVFVALRLHK